MKIQKTAIVFLFLAFSAAFGIAFHFGGHLIWSGPGNALAQTRPEVKTVVLAKDQKLKEANWHCYAGGYCELWTLTKPRKPEDKAETYLYQNADGSRQYVIREQ